MTDRQEPPSEPDAQNAPEVLTQGVADVISAMFGVGASIARTIAEATAQKDKPPSAPPSDRPLDGLVHYSITAATNVIGLVISGIGSATSAVRQEPDRGTSARAPASGARESALPHVSPGSTLRVPLSIENPGDETMQGMGVVCTSLTSDTTAPGRPLEIRSVRFQPDTLTIAPRDFEKLTVFVDTEPDTAPGTYEAVIGIGAEGYGARIRFDVRAAEAGS